jgi:hypothetical protein
MFFDLFPTLSIFFRVKIQLFVTLNSDQDPIRMDPHCFGSLDPKRIWIRIEIKSLIRIRIKTNADPQHWFDICLAVLWHVAILF